MRLLQRFVTIFVRSSTDPSYYIQVLFSRFRSSVLFFVGVTALLSLFTVLYWRLVKFPVFYNLVQTETTTVFSKLPDSFFARYENSQLSLEGVPLPVRIESSKELQKTGVSPLLVTFDDPDQKEALLRLRQEDFSITLPAETGLTSRSVPYKDFASENFTFTKGQLEGRIKDELAAIPTMMNVMSVVFLPLYFAFFTISLLIAILFLSLLAHSLVWFVGIRMRFLKMLQLCLHAGAIAAMVEEVRKVLYPSTFVSLFWPSLLAIMLLVLWQLGKKRYNT